MSEFQRITGGVPVPSSTLVQTDQSTILGDGSHDHPLHAGPGVQPSASSPIVFRPGGVSTQNVVATWPEVMTALGKTQGDRILQFDDSVVSPVVIPFPASGSYPMAGVVWASFPGRSAQISIPEGVLFTELRTLTDGVRVTFTGITPPVSDFGTPGSPSDLVRIDRAATLTCTGLGPFFRLFASGSFAIGESSGILTGSHPTIDVPTSSTATILADGAFAALEPSTVSGVAGATLILDVVDSAAGDSNGSLSESQPGFSGSILARNATADRAYPTAVETGNTVLSAASVVVRVDPTGAGFDVTLPSAALFRGQSVTIKNVSASANVVRAVAGGGDNVDGAANQSLSGAHFHWRATSDGVSQWMVTG